jgi:hypothetical protein
MSLKHDLQVVLVFPLFVITISFMVVSIFIKIDADEPVACWIHVRSPDRINQIEFVSTIMIRDRG